MSSKNEGMGGSTGGSDGQDRPDVGAALRATIASDLATSRRNRSLDDFRTIQTVLLSWLEMGVNERSAATVEKKLGLRPDQVAGMLALGFDGEGFRAGGTAQSRIWAKCALGLVQCHPLSALSEKFQSREPPGPEACMKEIREIAAKVRGERTKPRNAQREAQRRQDLEEYRKKELKRFNELASLSLRREMPTPGELSSRRISPGLRRGLRRLYGQVEKLTVDQVEVLEASFKHRKLWIEGPAGTGKTIVAMEIAYRTLWSGGTCAILYRTSQFKEIMEVLLGTASEGRLFLFPQFMEFWASWIRKSGELDLLIVDDYATLGLNESTLVAASDSAGRTIVLAARDQSIDTIGFPQDLYLTRRGFLEAIREVSSKFGIPESPILAKHGISDNGIAPERRVHLMLDPFKADKDEEKPSRNVSGLRVERCVLDCPPGFARVSLTRNLRSAARIVDYGRCKFDIGWDEAVVDEEGMVTPVSSSWEALDSTLRNQIRDLIRSYAPDQMRILADPHLVSLGQRMASRDWIDPLPPLVKILLRVGVQSDKRLFEVGSHDFQDVVKEIPEQDLYLAWTSGDDAGLLLLDDIAYSARGRQSGRRPSERLRRSRLAAKEAFAPELLADRIAARNVILLYPTQLFIGLESDVVIYVRNARDAFDWYGTDKREVEALKQARARHHALAISRARFHLVDIAVS